MSTIRVNTIQSTSTTDGGISIDSSGNITLPASTKVGTQNLPSAGPLSNRNLIINGAMQVAQRGTSQTTSGYGTVDRFFPSFSGGALTTTQESLTSGDPYDAGFRKFARLTNTTAATGAANYRLFVQQIEGQNVANSGWNYASATSYVTLSFWIRSSVSQAFSVRLRSLDGTDQNYPMSTGTLTADTWTKVTKTIPGNSNITMDNDNTAGLRVEVAAFWGTDFTDSGVTLDAWAAHASGTRTFDMANTWAATAGATLDITGVQLEVGSVATPFEHRSYGDELQRCKRYFQAVGTVCSGFCEGTTRVAIATAFHPEMRTTPSISVFAGRTARFRDNATDLTITNPTLNNTSTNRWGVWTRVSTSGRTNGNPITGRVNGTDGDFIAANAEL